MSEKEREVLLRDIRNELVNLVSSRVVHPETNRLFPAKIIEEAIYSLGFDVKINDSAKKQANYLIKELANKYLLKKADMEIKVTIREEWIHEGEKAGLEIQPIEAKAGHDHSDNDSEDEVPKQKITKKTDKEHDKKTEKEQDALKAAKKKKPKKNSDEDWDKMAAKSDNFSKGFGNHLI